MIVHPDLDCIKISANLTTSTTKPVTRSVDLSLVWVEVSLALAQYLVKDDSVRYHKQV